MYIRTPRAAVYVDPAEALFKTKPPRTVCNEAAQVTAPPPSCQRPASTLAGPSTQSSRYRPRILWADRPLLTSAGRFVGARLNGQTLEVALVRVGSQAICWVKPEGWLSQRQVDRWVAISRFR